MADSAIDLIAASNYAGSTTSLTFTGIPQTYKHLKIIANLCTDVNAGQNYSSQNVHMRLNNDSTAGTYRWTKLGMGASTYADDETNGSYADIGIIAGDSDADYPHHSPLIVTLFNYSANEPTSWQAECGFTKDDNSGISGTYLRSGGGVATAGSGSDWGISQIEIYASNVNLTSTSRISILGYND